MTETEIIKSIGHLRTDKNSTLWDQSTQGQAPHKPFLLLSIMDGIEIGWINQPKVILNSDLIETFFCYWRQIMGDDRNTTIALPFFHMKSEPFWELRYNNGMRIYKNSPSLGGLMKRVAYARIDNKMFAMMRNEEGKQLITKIILETYFAGEVSEKIMDVHNLNIEAYRYAKKLELLVAEPFEKYHDKKEADKHYSRQKKQQRQFGFGLRIRENYNHQCAICRTKINTPNGESLVEGAHIIPWHESRNDDPRNGLALCKTHHWMFDKYLFTIQPDYRIKLSQWLKKEGEQVESTLRWDKKEILLPSKQQFFPSEIALKDHYGRFINNYT